MKQEVQDPFRSNLYPSTNLRKVGVTNVYLRTRQAKSLLVLNEGGARSSKSHSIGQRLTEKFNQEQRKGILVTRKTGPALFLTAYQLIFNLLTDYGIYKHCRHDKTHNYIYNPYTGSRFVFASVDDPEKIKSTEWNYVWMEEANEFTWEDFIVIKTRMSGPTIPGEPNQIFLSYNPTDEQGWIKQRIIENKAFAGKHDLIRSSYRDNAFLSEDYIRELRELKSQDPDAWKVFAEGEYAHLTNIVYRPYSIVNACPFEPDDAFYGLDFGYNNPAALIRVQTKDKFAAHLTQLIYKTHLTNSQLIDEAKEVIPEDQRDLPIYADSAEPDRIEEFAQAGFNIVPAEKDVKDGIDFCKRFKFSCTSHNIDLLKERGVYKWRTDKNGNVLEDPVKFMDHLMDAKRYSIYTHYKQAGVEVTFG